MWIIKKKLGIPSLLDMSARSVRLTNYEYSTNSMAEIRFNKMQKTCSRIKTVALTYSIESAEQ